MIDFNRDYTSEEIELIQRERELEYQEDIRRQFPDIENGNGSVVRKGKKSTKTQEDEEVDDKNDYYPINKYSQGIPLAEAILVNNIPYFIQIIDGKPVYNPEIELLDINIVPPERTEYLSKEYSFDSFEEVQYFIDLAKNETLDSLFNKVKNELKKYIDVDENFINILSADIVFTYFQDKLGMTHYLLIVGDNNTGKSNVLLVFSFLGYRTILDIAITPANIYNYGSQLEDGQFTLIEDEIGDIDELFDKKKLYQSSYKYGFKVTRIYDSNSSGGSKNGKRKSSRQNSFFLYGFKMFASEKMPDKTKSKGFLERIIPAKMTPGDPSYDISEVIDGSGDEQLNQLYKQLIDTRKLLLMYRLLHHNEIIPNITLNIKNRYKQLTKPVIRLFQNSESVDEIRISLSKYLIEKNQEKLDSMDAAILTFIINLVSEKGETLYNDHIWNELKKKYPNGEVQDKPYSWYIEGYGLVSKNNITKTCETKFCAKTHRDPKEGRGLILNQKILNKLVENYSIIDGIKIIKEEETPNDTYDTYDTSTECLDKKNTDSVTKNVDNMADMIDKQEHSIPQNDNTSTKKVNDKDIKFNGHSQKVSYSSYVSQNRKSTIFNNPLISKQDLQDPNGFQYDPEIINNITKSSQNSDRWFCYKCNMKDDKWFMMKHPCNNNNNKK
jgi:hypothetical protein